MQRAIGPIIFALVYLLGTHPVLARDLVVRIEDSNMHLFVSGDGKPTIVLEAGFSGDHRTWDKVQDLLAASATVVSYDRLGAGQSEISKRPRTAEIIAEQLHLALAKAKLPPPYVMVGHSYGGPLVRVFSSMYKSEIAGIVLVDPAVEGFYVRASKEQPMEYLNQLEEDLSWTEQQASNNARREALAYETSMLQASLSKLPANVPVVLLSATKMHLPQALRAIWLDEQSVWAKTVGAQVTKVDSGHNIHRERPELVLKAVSEILAVGRTP